MGIHPFLVLLSISVSMHLLVQRLFFKVAWILQQNFIAILWQYWWTIFLRKAILAPSHSKHVINMCRCDQGRRKKKNFSELKWIQFQMLFSFSTIRRKKMVRKCAYFLSPYWACRHFREQLIKSCQTLITKFSLGEHKIIIIYYTLWIPLIIKLLQWNVLHRLSLPSRYDLFSFPLMNFCHSYPKR